MKDNKTNKRNQIMFYALAILAVIIFSGIGYAYFSAGVSNTNNEKINAGTATLSLVFEDNDNGISGTLNLGESVTKKFTIENTGTVDTYATINWVNLVNTYQPRSLSYILEQSTSENGTYTTKTSNTVPSSATASTGALARKLLIPTNTKYYYKLTITLNSTDVNQNSDISAVMNSKFNIVEDTSTPTTTTIQNLVAGSPTNSTDVITKDAPSGASCTNTLAYDGTADNNLRYVGANPCNYVTFNGENPVIQEDVWVIANTIDGLRAVNIYETETACQTALNAQNYSDVWECQNRDVTTGGWRIIGVMNNIDDGTGNLETRIKLVRNESLGGYMWDSSASNINGGGGLNDWTQADLMHELNGDYLNTNLNENTMWYDWLNDRQNAVFDYTKKLNTTSQNIIGIAKWSLGGFENKQANLIPSTMYNMERGTKVYPEVSGQNCSDVACPRVLFWVGKVALIYPSDYALATAGGNETNRYTCIKTYTTSINASDNRWNLYTDCRNNDWIFSSSSIQWTISPDSYSRSRSNTVYTNGIVYDYLTSDTYAVRPSVYLTSEVSIASGSGIETDPYVIG